MAHTSRQFQPNMFGLAESEPPSVRRSRTTNDPSSRCNQATAEGRRVNDLLRDFLREMGNPTNATAQFDALHAAELAVSVEDARAELLAGNGDADKVVRLGGEMRRAVRKLGIERRLAAKPKQTLAEYVRQKSAVAADDVSAAEPHEVAS